MQSFVGMVERRVAGASIHMSHDLGIGMSTESLGASHQNTFKIPDPDFQNINFQFLKGVSVTF